MHRSLSEFSRCWRFVLFLASSCAQSAGDSQSGHDGGGFDPSVDAQSDATDCNQIVRCSRDLHAVVKGCDETVIATCADDEGCAYGSCVPACDSVAAAEGSVGCSFWATTPTGTQPGSENYNGSCFAAFIANTWNTPITVHAEYAGEPLSLASASYLAQAEGQDVSYSPLGDTLAPGMAAVIFLADSGRTRGGAARISCPPGTSAALAQDSAIHGTGRNQAIHLTTSAPASAYVIWPYGGAESFEPTATLLLPDTSWRNDYIVVEAWDALVTGSGVSKPWIQVLANTDDTRVTMIPKASIVPGQNLEGASAGVSTSWVLARGEYLQFLQSADLNGSPISADKPIAVFGGTECMQIPAGLVACDTAQQQIPPVSTWGSEYVGVRYRSRIPGEESAPFRVVGAVAGTTLTYDPEAPEGAPSQIGYGEVATFSSSFPFVVTSQDQEHVFYVSSHMTGGYDKSGEMGDPEFVNIVPAQQYLDHYVFFTDYTYSETDLVLVRAKGPNGFADVTLDCAGFLGNWAPVGRAGRYEFTRVDLSRAFAPVVYDGGTCGNGSHEVFSDGPFEMTVWGWGRYASYAYPGGAGLQKINSVVVPR